MPAGADGLIADIAFVHTSPVHVPTFDELLHEVAPQLHAVHHVHEDLLARARQVGMADTALVADLHRVLDEAAAQARVVVCTCSTLGGLAESAPQPAGTAITRVDRAMADAAVRDGRRVLVVAAVQSTLQPTQELLRSSAARLEQDVDITTLWVEPAWPHFEAGRLGAYIDSLVEAVSAARADGVVVLAQASMAPAAARLAARGFTVLTSPRLGVEHAVRVWRELPRTATTPS